MEARLSFCVFELDFTFGEGADVGKLHSLSLSGISSNHSAIRSGVIIIFLDFASFFGVVVLMRSFSPRSKLR